MPFPTSDHVVYENNPLENVICQVRFPTILRIDSEPPSALQERLKPDYIHLTESSGVFFDIKMGGKPILANEGLGDSPPSISKQYEFATDDNKWKVNLTRNSLSLSTTSYVTWEEFRVKFEYAFNVFVEIYKPVLLTRIGLRYIDVVVRSKLRMNDVGWKELIAEPILGVLASDLKDSISELQSMFLVNLKDKPGVVRVVSGTMKNAESGESCFLIDSDYYDETKRKPDEVIKRLEVFHSKAYDLFRWCITPELHKAMKPKEVK